MTLSERDSDRRASKAPRPPLFRYALVQQADEPVLKTERVTRHGPVIAGRKPL
jgi:hypothetical protein